MRSLRTSLVLGATISTAAVLLTIGVVLYVLVRAGLVAQFDQALADKARMLASTVRNDGGAIELEFEEFDMHEFQTTSQPAYLQLAYADGPALFRSASLAQADLNRFSAQTPTPSCRPVTLPDGRRGRAVSMTFLPQLDKPDPKQSARSQGRRITLVLARGSASIDETLVRLATILLLVSLPAIGLSAVILWLVITRRLGPLRRLAAEIGQLDEQGLSTTIEAGSTVRELSPVTQKLNQLFGRLEAAFERERCFSADVAHELRTPLAGLRSTIEVVLLEPRDPAEYREALTDSLDITAQMHEMVENLLTLARLEAGQIAIRSEPVSPNEMLRATWGSMSRLVEARQLRIQWTLEPQACISTDPSLFGLVVRNILGNAVAYADQGGLVSVGTCTRDGVVVVRVDNSGSRLSQEHAEHVFDRFWRGDSARRDAVVHCGLGLSLVKKIVDLLDGSVIVQSSEGGEFCISVSFPS